MDLISEVLKNDSDSLNTQTTEPTTSFKPQVNNERFSISDVEEVKPTDIIGEEEPTPEAPTNDFIGDPEPAPKSATLFDEKPAENSGAVYTDLSPDEKKRNELTAQLYVILLDTGAGFAFQLTAGDFSEESEKKYSLSKSKQKDLAKAWAEVLNIEQKVTDPKSQFYKLMFAVYLPLLIAAIGARVKKQKAKKIMKEKTVLEKQMENMKAASKIKKDEAPKAEVKENLIDDFFEASAPDAPIKINLEPVQKNTAKVFQEPVQKTAPVEKKARGRSQGTKRNPANGKFEKYYKIENGFYHWSWGATQAVKKVDNEQ